MKRLIHTIGFLLLLFCLIGCKEEILHNLSESEANRILTRLHGEEIIAEKIRQADGYWAISVKSSDSILALTKLSDARVFRRGRTAAPSSGMLPSRDAQRFEYERAVSQEIEISLEALEGVLEARVHLYVPLADPLLGGRAENEQAPSASVLLIQDDRFHEKSEDIAALVGGAAGMKAKQVSVLVTPAERGERPEVQDVAPFALPEQQLMTETTQTSARLASIPIRQDLVIAFLLFMLGGIVLIYFFKTPSRQRRTRGNKNFSSQLRALEEVRAE